MELSFESVTQEHLQCVARTVLYQEETTESVIPDSFPDAGRIVSCHGQALLRTKECRDGGVTLEGTIRAAVLYLPEEAGKARPLAVQLPFSVRMDNSAVTMHDAVAADLTIKAMDARIVNSRKILVRADLAAAVSVYTATAETFYPTVSACPGLQVRREELQVTWPMATGEKAFVISDEVELGDKPPVGALCRWSAVPVVRDRKLIGNKAVFKGTVCLQVLYQTEDENFETFNFQLPFSQFLDLDYEGGEDDVSVTMVLTGAELEPDGLEHCTRLRLTLNALAQAVVTAQRPVTVLRDLYSTRQQVTPQLTTYALESRLDRQLLSQTVRETIQGPIRAVVDAAVFLEPPTQSREGTRVQLRCPAVVSLLYYDDNGVLQGTTRRMEAQTATDLAEGCLCLPQATTDGVVTAVPTAGGAEVWFEVAFDVECRAAEQITAVCGAETADLADTARPSVIIRAAGEQETLWSIAKACRSTEEAIMQANHLTEEDAIGGRMLLIPLVS
jgi:hypothetical protein